jgi:hypothetical protein
MCHEGNRPRTACRILCNLGVSRGHLTVVSERGRLEVASARLAAVHQAAPRPKFGSEEPL